VPFGSANVTGAAGSKASQYVSDGSSSSAHHYEKHIKCMGPVNVSTAEAFYRKLEEDGSCWAIIDKESDRAEDLVSVWDIILDYRKEGISSHNEDQCIQAAKLLCEAWIHQVKLESNPMDGIKTDSRFKQGYNKLKDLVFNREQQKLYNIRRLQSDGNPITYHPPQPPTGLVEPIILPRLNWGANPVKELTDHLRPIVIPPGVANSRDPTDEY
jgi:hypothetical protein